MCKFDWEDDSPYLKTKKLENTEAVVQRCSYEKVFWKYAANLQENTHAEVKVNKVDQQILTTWYISTNKKTKLFISN